MEYFKNPHNFTGDTFDGILTPLLNQITQILNSPNNILGIEYCKALNRLKSSLKPVTLKRQGMGYHDTLTAASSAHAVSADISGKNPPFASASAIRELLTSTLTQETIAQISAQVPDETSAFFVSSLRNNGYLSEEVLDDLLIYRIMYEDAESLSQYLDVSGNLAERIINCRNEISGFTQAASLLKTKELTQTRIQRALLHSILQIREAPLSVPYSRVLGFRKESSPLLKEIKKNSTLPVLTKLADSDALLVRQEDASSETTAAPTFTKSSLQKERAEIYSRISETVGYFLNIYTKLKTAITDSEILIFPLVMAVFIILTAESCHYQEPYRLRF